MATAVAADTAEAGTTPKKRTRRGSRGGRNRRRKPAGAAVAEGEVAAEGAAGEDDSARGKASPPMRLRSRRLRMGFPRR